MTFMIASAAEPLCRRLRGCDGNDKAASDKAEMKTQRRGLAERCTAIVTTLLRMKLANKCLGLPSFKSAVSHAKRTLPPLLDILHPPMRDVENSRSLDNGSEMSELSPSSAQPSEFR